MKYALGKWAKMMETNCLPGKTRSQLNIQTQRMMGQQSLGEYMGIHLDPVVVFRDNAQKVGDNIKRKNGLLINTGNNPTKDEREAKIKENKKKYGLSADAISKIVLPEKTVSTIEEKEVVPREDKRSRLDYLKKRLALLEEAYVFKGGNLEDIKEKEEKTKENKMEVDDQATNNDEQDKGNIKEDIVETTEIVKSQKPTTRKRKAPAKKKRGRKRKRVVGSDEDEPDDSDDEDWRK
eukprot:TRINITY_DN10823_c0_g1_i1.p1 TRINITY_DN10823_c0_g1~~TRINITY_DN10823_c0_g1_i1.p1  ORF type:complete len:277 (+),score=74.22 TRINITY_DN10823_c0_g1_i1:126-833(+)